VPVELAPPTTAVGLSATVETVGPSTVSAPLTAVLFKVALMFAVEFVATATVLTVNVAVLEPAATVTEAGTVAAARLELNVTTLPPDGASPARVSVAVVEAPPSTVVGFSVTL